MHHNLLSVVQVVHSKITLCATAYDSTVILWEATDVNAKLHRSLTGHSHNIWQVRTAVLH